MAHNAAPELLKQTSLQWLTHVVTIHLCSGTILNPEISLLNLIRQEKVTDVDCSVLLGLIGSLWASDDDDMRETSHGGGI